mgnify:CR=1 FL=1
MFVNMSSVVVVTIALSMVMIAYGIVINIEAIATKRNMNPRAMFIIMAIIFIGVITLICNIDYEKSTPNEVYTNKDLVDSYNGGYDAGYEKAYSNIEDWFCNLESVTIGSDDITIHLIDGNGEEWVLVSDDYQN